MEINYIESDRKTLQCRETERQMEVNSIERD